MDYNEAKRLYEQGEMMHKEYKPFRDLQIRQDYYELRKKRIDGTSALELLSKKYCSSESTIREAMRNAKKILNSHL